MIYLLTYDEQPFDIYAPDPLDTESEYDEDEIIGDQVIEEVIEDESVTKSEWCSHTPSNTLYIEEE